MSGAGTQALQNEDEDFIVDKAVKGYDAQEIAYMLRHDENKPIRDETVEEFLSAEGTQQRVETEKRIRERKAEITKQDLLNELSVMKTDLQEWINEIKEQGHGKTANEAYSNVLTITKQIGELIGELENKTQQAENIININKSQTYIEQNFSTVVQHISPEQKEDVIEQLKDDPEVENFVIERKN